jgi:hypothetical protein
MKARTVIMVMVLGLWCVTGRSFADESRLDGLYGEVVDKKIEQCELKAAKMNSRCERIKLSAEAAQRQANYFRIHKDLLVREMLEEQVATNPHRINHFLIERYGVYVAEQEHATLKVSGKE